MPDQPTVESTPTAVTTGFVPRPADFIDRYRARGCYLDAPLWQLLDDAATSSPDSPALTDPGAQPPRTLTYAALLAATRRRAGGFLRAGLQPGQRVVVQQNNTAELVVNVFALMRAGLLPVMALPAHRRAEITHLARTSGASAYVTEDGRHGFDHRTLATDLVDDVESLAHVFIDGDPGGFLPLPDADGVELPSADGIDANLPALFLISGGTTGLPKLIPRTHNDYSFNARRSAEIAGLVDTDVYLVALPGAHNFPLCCPGMLGVISTGGHIVLGTDPSPDAAFDLIETYGVTVTALVPALAQVWCAATEWEPADISSLRLLQVGGAKLAEPDAVALDAALGDVVQQVFGMAEGLICYTRLDDPRELVHTTQGRPMSDDDELRVVDESGVDVPVGTEGELLVRGPYTIRGYYRADDHNTRSFTDDGFYRSGDRVRVLPSGHVAVTGRIKDTIVRAGENVAADDVEESLLAHPSIRQVAVIGLPDDSLGERICAVVVPTDGPKSPAADLRTLRTFLTDQGVAPFKLPDQVIVATRLPVTPVGKIDKRALVEEVTAAPPTSPPAG